ncbi:hypothetical protein CF327_g823 [Tilletia walkeri]|nr:hypothetical protein CF327_g823 [Tilletia walkeri]
MCGIVCLINKCGGPDVEHEISDALRRTCDRRGPDAQTTFSYTSTSSTSVLLHTSVLSLRGKDVTSQPIHSSDGRLILAWNGQIFRHEDDKDEDPSPLLDAERNDGEELLKIMERSLRDVVEPEAVGSALSSILRTIEGPYAFVLLDTKTQQVYFGRDPLGRRSLLLRRPSESAEQSLMLCPVADQRTIATGSNLVEVDCSRSIWRFDLSTDQLPEAVEIPRGLEPLLLSDLQVEAPLVDVSCADRLATAHDFRTVLEDSVRRRVTNIRAYTRSDETHVAVLFSGGLDCATIALLAHQYLDPDQPIDLLNVALENPRSLQAAARARSTAKTAEGDKGKVVDPYDVPDRQTGVATYRELCALAPGRKWNFVRVDVPYVDYCEAKEEIRATMYPSNSVMDLSIAAALYFAARGRGLLLDTLEPYETSARILLSGLGADELLGGYSRHRVAFQKGGKAALIQELQLDLDRLPTRNLGRDDRILSTHAKEARYPFLDRDVLSHLCSLRVEDKMLFSSDSFLPADSESPYPGDKLILRLLAGELLKMHGAARLKKRAIQFGSRSAKMEIEVRGGKVKGHEELGE